MQISKAGIQQSFLFLPLLLATSACSTANMRVHLPLITWTSSLETWRAISRFQSQQQVIGPATLLAVGCAHLEVPRKHCWNHDCSN